MFKILLPLILLSSLAFAEIQTVEENAASSNEVITGQPDNLASVNKLIQADVKPKEVLDSRKEVNTMLKALNSPLNKTQFITKKIYNKDPIDKKLIKLKKGYPALVKLLDYNGNLVEIKGIKTSDGFSYDITDKNEFYIEASKIAKEGFFTITLKDGSHIQCRIIEDSNGLNTDTDVTIYTLSNTSYMDSTDVKTKIITNLINYNVIPNGDEVKNFKLTNFFNKQVYPKTYLFGKLSMYKYDDNTEKFLIVSLDRKYTLNGFSHTSFSRYNQNYNIYFLPANTNTLLISSTSQDIAKEQFDYPSNSDRNKIEKIIISILD